VVLVVTFLCLPVLVQAVLAALSRSLRARRSLRMARAARSTLLQVLVLRAAM
jgi:hypothetical protein